MKICITCEGASDTEDDRCAHCATRLIDTTMVHYPVRRGEADAGNPWIGRVIAGKYRLLEVLGVGGMGTVFSAVHEVSLVQVALKLLNPGLAARAEYRTWFLAEARKAGQVAHENSARILDVGQAQDGTVYIAVELVAGVTLHEWIRSERLRDPTLVADILEQMAKALAAAHDASVCA